MSVDETPVVSGKPPAVIRSSDEMSHRLSRISCVSLEIRAEIGRTRLPIRSVLELGVGQVIELDRQVGAPIDIIANKDVLVARGEVVEIDDEYGVRITEVIQGVLT